MRQVQVFTNGFSMKKCITFLQAWQNLAGLFKHIAMGIKLYQRVQVYLIPININENATQEIPKSPQDQQNLDGTILKVFKGLDIPLIIACKKSKVDGKPNKKRKRSSKDGFFAF
jgi:hypothetical protein